VRPISDITRRPSENGRFSQSLRQAQILILEILQCIPVVKIFAFPRTKLRDLRLDLEKNISFSDSLIMCSILLGSGNQFGAAVKPNHETWNERTGLRRKAQGARKMRFHDFYLAPCVPRLEPGSNDKKSSMMPIRHVSLFVARRATGHFSCLNR
jgi:hypothetical protein